MKRVLLFAFSFLLIQGLSFGQAQRKALVEEFTNASCPPCASQNPAFNTLIEANLDKIIPLKYQTDFPGFDPMNEQNPTEVDTRQGYYSISGVPTAAIDGTVPGDTYAAGAGDWDVAGGGYAGGPYGYTQAVYDFASNQTTPIEIHLDHNLSADLSMITIDVKIKNVDSVDFVLTAGKLHIALTEKDIQFPFAPGSTDESHFTDVMRKMYPNENGTSLTMIPAGDSVGFQMVEAVPSYIYDYTSIGIVAFVQDDADKAVWQAEISGPKAIVGDFPDIAFEVLTVDPTELCGASVTPSVKITNSGTIDVTSFDVSYALNAGTPVVESWTGTLAPGTDITVDFPTLQLAGGTSTVAYDIENVNGGVQELNSLNNLTSPATFASLSAVATLTELVEDNEDYEVGFPEGTVVQSPGTFNSFFAVRRSDLTNTAGDPLGGYGASEKSVWINFWQWQDTNAEGSITYDKIDLSNSISATLTYDRAAAGYQGDIDRLQVLVSTDCGGTWDIVNDITGNDIVTGDGNSSTFFLPTATEWATDAIDLSAYVGNAGVHIQFKGISSWGNNVYLDNINLIGESVGTSAPNLLEGKVKVFPNPTSEEANIEFELVEDSFVDIKVYDLTGKLVRVLNDNTHISAGKHIRVWKGEKESGVYLVKIRTNQGELTQRLTVVK